MECTTSFETLLGASIAGSGIIAILAMIGMGLLYRYALFDVPVANIIPAQATTNLVYSLEV